MTTLEQRQADFMALNGAYMLLRANRASNSLLLELLDHVNAAHAAYMAELKLTIADAKEVAA